MNDLGNACSGFSDAELNELKGIVSQYTEASGLVIKVAGWVGNRAESLMKKAPADWQTLVIDATDLALRESYRIAFAIQSDEQSTSMLNRAKTWAKGERWHKISTGVTGAVGGFGGLATTMAELPVTTTLVLRSIQQIAGAYGEDVSEGDVRAQCIAVFALSGPLAEDDEADTGLFAARLAITGKTVAEAMKAVLPRLGIAVGQKAITQGTPLLGAIAGATINTAFLNYYQMMAHVHFRLRRLERAHDREQVQACFERILSGQRKKQGSRKLATRTSPS